MTAPDFYQPAIAAFRAGDNARARDLSEQGLASARAARSLPAEVEALCMLARVALREGDMQRVDALASEAFGVAHRSGDVRLQRIPLHLQAAAARLGGDAHRAAALYEESLALNEDLGERRMVVVEQRNLAYVRWHLDDEAAARDLFAKARAGAEAIGYEDIQPYLLMDAAVVAVMDVDYQRAASLLHASEVAIEAAGQVPDPDDQEELRGLRERLSGDLEAKAAISTRGVHGR